MKRYRVTHTLAALAVTALVLGGCSDRPDPSTPSASTGTPTYVDRSAALARIPLDGADPQRPLVWELEFPEEPAASDATETAQHYEAVVALLLFQKRSGEIEDRELLPHLATDDRMEFIDSLLRSAPNPDATETVGPQWIGLLDVETAATEARVIFCFDLGYWSGSGLDGDPRPDGQRSRVSAYRLVKEADKREQTHWKVDQVAHNNVEVTELGLELLTEDEVKENQQRCDDWAVHTPDDL